MVLLLAVFAIPTALVPVRAQERLAAPVALPASEPGSAPVAADSGGKQEETGKKAPEETRSVDELPGLDPKIKELGEEVKKRMDAWSDEQTLTLKEGETGRMKIKKNVTPVAEILITPHFVEKETKLGLEGVDAAGKKIAGTATTSLGAPDGQLRSDNLGGTFHVDGENVMSMIQWKATRQDDDSVVVEAKALFMRVPTPEELEAMLLASMGKRGRVKADFMKIDHWIWEYRNVASHDPKSLAELNKPLPKDYFSPTGEDYHYEVQRSRYILSSCGPDGTYGNDDDDIEINDHHRHSVSSGTRRSLYPLPEEKDADAETETETTPGQGTVASAKAPDQNGGRFHLVRSSHTWIGTDGAPLVYDEYDKNFYMFWGEHTVVLPRHTEGFFEFYRQRTLFPEGCARMDVSRDHPASDPLANVVMPGAIDLPAYQLLLQPSVQRALNLSDEQRTRLRDISTNYWPERRQIAGKELADTESAKQTELAEYAAKARHGVVASGHLGDGSPFSKEVVEKLERQWSGARKQIEEVLTPEQLRTLKDLTFRTFAFGSGVMFEPEVFIRLGVAKTQQDQLRTLELQLQKEKERRLRSVPREKIKKMLAVLTRQQQAQLREKHSPDENPDTDCSMYPYPGLPSHMPDTGVAEELGLSAEQCERVRKIVSAHWTTLGALQQEEQNLTLGDEKAFKAIGEKRRQEMADLRKQIEAALTPEQWASCKEMAFENLAMPSLRMAAGLAQLPDTMGLTERLGMAAYMALSGEMALTEQQRAALREIEAEYVDKPEQIYCEMTDKALAAFTPAQQERLRAEVDRRGW